MSPAVVANNKVVSIRYVLRDEHGRIAEMSDLPVSYVHGGASDLFPGIERALEGKSVGEQVVVELEPHEAFGERDPKLTFIDDLENAPPELRRVGAQFEAENASGETIALVVTAIGDGKITVDANHPLAGQRVRFDVTVADIRDATAAELDSGRPGSPFDAGTA
jgi:FKBP-type peptidyl-prolyl cis-trans isomerase SlyD